MTLIEDQLINSGLLSGDKINQSGFRVASQEKISLWIRFWPKEIFHETLTSPPLTRALVIIFCSPKSKPISVVTILDQLRTYNKLVMTKQLKTFITVSRSLNNIFMGVQFPKGTLLKKIKMICNRIVYIFSHRWNQGIFFEGVLQNVYFISVVGENRTLRNYWKSDPKPISLIHRLFIYICYQSDRKMKLL